MHGPLARSAAGGGTIEGAAGQGRQPGDGDRRGRAARLDRGAVRIEGRGRRELQARWSSRRCGRTGLPRSASASPATTCSTSPGRCACAEELDAHDRIEFEMLEGMAPPQARQVHAAAGGLLLYCPVVRRRRLHGQPRLPDPPPRREHRSPRTSCARCSRCVPDSPLFDREAARFRAAVEQRHSVSTAAVAPPADPTALDRGRRAFDNEPDSDVTDPVVRAAFAAAMVRPPQPAVERITDVAAIDAVVERAAASFARGRALDAVRGGSGCSTRPR